MNQEVKVSGGISFMGLLQVALIVLRLCNVITCSWWVVLLPVWLTILIMIVCLILVILTY